MASAVKPPPLHSTRSFSRMEPPPVPIDPTSPSKRASTLQETGIPAIPEARHIDISPEITGKRPKADVFENNEEDAPHDSPSQTPGPELKLPNTFEELPIEIKSLSERFIESLSAKIHPAPLNADNLSDLFQDFYERAASHINTHIASLASRIGRKKTSSAQNGAARSAIKGRPRAGSGAKASSSDDLASLGGGEMLTVAEVAHRKKARRLLELKRVALEEAVERCVCEKMYEKIWKHRSTNDDARDEKLRSRTAALSLVGIGLKELHMDHDPTKANVRKTAEEKEDEIHQSLATARESLQRMDDEQYPLGKLQHLTAAHKSIVETLSQLFPSSSSADEILPTLIYTLITSPPEGINVVSNLNFIQRFRASSKVDGEAAYCLVNLEAAISFLETVDLSSLRADELPEGPPKSSSRPSTPTTEKTFQPARPNVGRTLTPGVSPVTANATSTSQTLTTNAASRPSRPAAPPRQLSNMVQAQADRIEASRENFLTTADKVYESINNTLDTSLQFVFGRFMEQQQQQRGSSSPLPKTLEDARKLVNPATPEEEETLDLGGSGRSSPADDPLSAVGSRNSGKSLLATRGGSHPLRDRSVDSTRSGGSGSGSGKRVSFHPPNETAAPTPATPAGNLFANMNPLNRFGMPTFPRFGRGGSGSGPATTTQPSPPHTLNSGEVPADARSRSASAEEGGEAGDEGEDLNVREALAALRRLAPPKRRFLEVGSAAELKLGEVEELLGEFRRLAKAIGEVVRS